MKALLTAVPLALAAILSGNALAAEQITRDQAEEMNLVKLGSVTTETQSSPMDANARLSQKADALGGKYYVIIAADEKDRVHVLAEVCK